MRRRIAVSVLAAAALAVGVLTPMAASADAGPDGSASSGPRQLAIPSWRADSPDAAAVPLTAARIVCTLTCDGEPVAPTADAVPVPTKSLAGRTLALHASLDQGVGWARLSGAQSGDRVWVERSFDAGSTREQPLAPTTASSADAATAPVNLADPSNHRRGVIRACADAGGTVCTAWAYRTSVDGTVVDGRAPDRSLDQQPVAAATTTNRGIRLHFGGNAAAWASLDAGTAGDSVWIERSWNAGTSTTGGALGRAIVPSGSSTASTAAFVAAEPRLKLYGGSVRACGRAAAAQTTACTAWARPAVDRLAAAADALAYDYDPYTAWWPSSWWNSAVAITTVIDYQQQTGDPTYAWMIDRTFEVNRRAYPAGEKSGDELPGNFVSRAIDDGVWWGFAWVRAYDLTGDAKYLQMAETIGDYTYTYWDTSTCDGGVWWNGERTYKNAVVNGQFIRLAAELHRRIPGDSDWLNRAVDGWNWYQRVGMVGPDGYVNDGLTDACANNGQTVWTYNQGLAIGDGVELYRATGDVAYLDRSRELAHTATQEGLLTVDGILTESCDTPTAANSCDDNQKQFKGVFMRYLQDLDSATGSYGAYADDQATNVWTGNRDALNRLGERWSGRSASGSPNVRDWRTQASGLSALLARR